MDINNYYYFNQLMWTKEHDSREDVEVQIALPATDRRCDRKEKMQKPI